jgi:hypothetical protein
MKRVEKEGYGYIFGNRILNTRYELTVRCDVGFGLELQTSVIKTKKIVGQVQIIEYILMENYILMALNGDK